MKGGAHAAAVVLVEVFRAPTVLSSMFWLTNTASASLGNEYSNRDLKGMPSGGGMLLTSKSHSTMRLREEACDMLTLRESYWDTRSDLGYSVFLMISSRGGGRDLEGPGDIRK